MTVSITPPRMYKKLAWIVFAAAVSLSFAFPTVAVFPSGNVVTTPGMNFSFTCHLLTPTSDTFRSVSWLLNGSTLESFERDHVIPIFEPGGTLSAVKNLEISFENSTLLLNRTAPFTLDIISTIDITYTVTVTSLSSSKTLYNVSRIDKTEINYPLPPGNCCENYVFTVTPLNGAGEGEPRSIALSQTISIPHLLLLTLEQKGDNDVIMYNLLMSAPVCDAVITLVDKSTGESLTLHGMDLNISTAAMSIKFTNERLERNTQYSFMMNATNINGSHISSGSISTYSIASSVLLTDPVRIQTEYLPNSDAAGVLYGFFRVGGSGIDFTNSLFWSLSRNNSINYELPFRLPNGVYYIHAYVLEQDGLLNSGEIFPATTTIFSESESSQTMGIPQSSPEDCEVLSVDLTMSIECFLHPMVTSTGYQVVVQEKGVNDARKLLVNRTKLGLPQTPVTVEVDKFGEYQVTVFTIAENLGILDSRVAFTSEIAVLDTVRSTSTTPSIEVSTSKPVPSTPNTITVIIGVGAGLALLAVILGGAILVTQCCRSRGPGNKPEEYNLTPSEKGEVPKEEVGDANAGALIYEEIGDAQTSFSYTRNILYGGLAIAGASSISSPPVPVPSVPGPGSLSGRLPELSLLEARVHEYELTTTAEYQSLDDAYQVQKCSAYGISLVKEGSSEIVASNAPIEV